MLPETVREAATRFGDRTAYLDEDGRPLTYADIDRISDGVAIGLSDVGVQHGDVVALVLPPGLDYLLAYVALAKLGAISAGVNDRLSARERELVLGRAEPKLVLAAPELGSDAFPTVEIERVESLQRDGAPPPLPLDDARDVAIIFTSGTTGVPKGARYGNRQLSFITQTDVGDAWGSGGRGMSGTSFAHLGFMTKLPGSLRRGGLTFVLRRWRAKDALELISSERMNSVAGVPTQLALMLRQPDFDSYDLSAVQFIVAGGGPITPGLAEEARARFGAKLATRYSCTEAGIGLGTAFDDPDEDAVVSVGRPHAAVALAVRDADDPDRPDARGEGEIGEVCLRSPACMTGYWHDEAATRVAFTSDGFVRTGDLGYVDEQGRLRLVGRSKEMYVRGGYNVYPVEVEAVLSTHPDVAAVAIVPRPDSVMGEVGVACVVARDADHPPSLVALRDHASDALASYKLPEAVRVLEALPLTAGEKVDRGALRDLLGETTTT
jgi:acyl-CoA synthetase (AMP-forming)/AMP-acid ligase II